MICIICKSACEIKNLNILTDFDEYCFCINCGMVRNINSYDFYIINKNSVFTGSPSDYNRFLFLKRDFEPIPIFSFFEKHKYTQSNTQYRGIEFNKKLTPNNLQETLAKYESYLIL